MRIMLQHAMRPLRFQPVYQTRVWGGRRLESLLGRHLPDARPYGESWEICDRSGAQSIVAGGPFAGKTLHELWTRHRVEVFGASQQNHPAKNFPILLKILDCCDVLSLQVHPPAAIAPSLGGEPKTEMWFVAHAEGDALIYAGLRRGTTRVEFEAALKDGTAASLVHSTMPRTGEFMLVESGRIHALGAGLLIYEIQQNSDTTYRVFDWNRAGLDGRPRPLHVTESLACIDFNDFEPAMQSPAAGGRMVECPHFAVTFHKIEPGGHADPGVAPDDFVCVAVVRGQGALGGENIVAGDFLLLPASIAVRPISAGESGLEWLEIKLPDPASLTEDPSRP
jgi:mannose-6-phosphate isomerase